MHSQWYHGFGQTFVEQNVKYCLKRGEGKECPLYTHNGTKALIRHLQKDDEAEWKLVVAASSRSAQAKSARRGARRGIRWVVVRVPLLIVLRKRAQCS